MPRQLNHPAPQRLSRILAIMGLGLASWSLPGCGDDDDDGDGTASPTNTGQACSTVEQCYVGVEDGTLLGEAVCLDRVEGGYCTHHCASDADCCAVPGECPGNRAQVCGPFESTGEMYCFLSCEDEDWQATTFGDSDLYCQGYAGAAFHCRSTGGGSQNRKVCVP